MSESIREAISDLASVPTDTRVLGKLEEITSQLTRLDELDRIKERLETCPNGDTLFNQVAFGGKKIQVKCLGARITDPFKLLKMSPQHDS